MSRSKAPMGLALLLVISGSLLQAAELSQETLQAWNVYVKETESGMQARLGAGHTFLWADEAPDRNLSVRRGNIAVAPLAGHGWEAIPGGLIHHWVGAAFIPNAGIDDVLAVVHDYGRYKQIYRPTVVDSKVLDYTPTEQTFSMLWLRKVLFVTAAVATDNRARDFRIDGKRCYSVTKTTRVQEIQKYGHSDQRVLPPDEGDGFIWRVSGIARYEERDGGVYVELEALALTRDIPASLRWMVAPVVTRLSRSSIVTTLEQTRQAVGRREYPTERASTSEGRSEPKALQSSFMAKPSMSRSWSSSGK